MAGLAEVVDGRIDGFIPSVSGFFREYVGVCFGTLQAHFRVDFGFILVVLGVFWRSWLPRGPPNEAGWKK